MDLGEEIFNKNMNLSESDNKSAKNQHLLPEKANLKFVEKQR